MLVDSTDLGPMAGPEQEIATDGAIRSTKYLAAAHERSVIREEIERVEL